MSEQTTYLTTEQAIARWGPDLQFGNPRKHFVEIRDADGLWKPKYDDWLKWIGYTLVEPAHAE